MPLIALLLKTIKRNKKQVIQQSSITYQLEQPISNSSLVALRFRTNRAPKFFKKPLCTPAEEATE